MASEADIMRNIQIAMSELGHRVFRVNTGLFYTKMGIPVRCGMVNGGSDLVGWLGDGSGRILAIEVKSRRGREEQDQIAFALAVQKAGGCAFFARSVEDATEKIKSFIDNTKISF